MSRTLPILFNTEMVKAILDGRKKATRRIAKRVYPYSEYGDFTTKIKGEFTGPVSAENIIKLKAPCHPGDILYVRETWRVGAWDIRKQMIAFDYKDGTCGGFVYIHDRELFKRIVNQSREDARKAKCEYDGVDFVWEKGKSPCRWHPSIHMPKEAARIWLKVTDVRVELLQEIDDKGAYDEGAGLKNTIYQIGGRVCDFAKIWNSTIKKKDIPIYGWEANPWVWVIEFRQCEKQEVEEWK